MFIKSTSVVNFVNIFTRVANDCRKNSLVCLKTLHCKLLCSHSGVTVTYLVTVVTYDRKMFMLQARGRKILARVPSGHGQE